MAIMTNLLQLSVDTRQNKGLSRKDRKYKWAAGILEEIKKLEPEDIMDDLDVVFDDDDEYVEITMTLDYHPEKVKLQLPEAGVVRLSEL